jgi:hypothetical protein
MGALLASIVLSHYISRGNKSKESLLEKRRSRKKFPADHFKKNPTHPPPLLLGREGGKNLPLSSQERGWGEFNERAARNARMLM